MATTQPQYEPRYLAGITLFNRGDFFEAHEVWESLWMDTSGADKPFYQGLIQAAVGLCHFCNGNVRGAAKLYGSSRTYMERFGPRHLGLDLQSFWSEMEKCFQPVLQNGGVRVPIVEEDIPEISLLPEPAEWPDPEEYLDHDES